MSRARYFAFSQQGGVRPLTNSNLATNKFQQTYPGATMAVFYTGGAGGFVSTSGTAVSLISGTPFNANSGWAGLTITIAGTPYVISSVNSNVSITLTSSAGTQASAAYSMPATAPAAIYSDNAGTPKSNPFTTDSTTGQGFFFADDGNYDVQFSGGGIVSPFTVSSQVVFDPSFVNLVPPGDPTDYPAQSLSVAGALYAKNVVSDPVAGVGAGGAIALASSPPNSQASAYIITNWSGGQSGSPPTDRFARDGGSCSIAFGIGTNGDAPQGCIRFSTVQSGNAGDHIVWAEKLDIGLGSDPNFASLNWKFTAPGTLTNLFVDTSSTIATPGLTALNTTLTPGVPSKSVLTGDQNTYALEVSVNTTRTAFQARDFAGDSTARNITLNELGGNVGIGTSTPTKLLQVNGTLEAGASVVVADDTSTVPAQLSVQGATNGNLQLLIGFNTSSSYGSIQAITQSVGGDMLRLNPSGGNVTSAPLNFIASETGANNAIVANSVNSPVAGLRILIQLAHSLQAGANTLLYNGIGPASIKSHRNPANDIGTAYVATGMIDLTYNGSVWLDMSQ